MDPFDLRNWPQFAVAGGDLSMPAIIDQVCIDSRRIASQSALFVALKGNLDGHDFLNHAIQQGARYAIVAKHKKPSAPEGITLLPVDSPLSAFQSLAKCYRSQLAPHVKVIAIAGSTGKTMLKDLLHLLLETTWHTIASPESFNSQIGVPLSLMTMKREHQIALIETAVSQQNEMQALADMIAPEATIVTHIGNKHLPTLGSLSNIASEIARLLTVPFRQDWQLIPESPLLSPFIQESSETYFWNRACNTLPHARFLNAENSHSMPYQLDFPNSGSYYGQITAGFSYCLDLINMAVKAAWLMQVPAASISAILNSYTPEPTRTEIWKSPQGATIINDIYCGDPQSLARSLNFFNYSHIGRKVFVFGGLRGNSHTEAAYASIGQAIDRAAVDLLITAAPLPCEVISKHAPQTKIVDRATYVEALHYLCQEVKSEDTVLIKGAKKQTLDFLMEKFSDSIAHNQCFINLDIIKSNIDLLRHKLPHDTQIMVMVKALAYGTDDVRMAKFLATCGISVLGVSYVDEGVALRRSGVKQAIFCINAALYEITKLVKWQLDVGVSDSAFIAALAQEAQRQGIRMNVHLHVDTGMSRLGCRPEHALMLAKQITKAPSLELMGIMTHFACSDQPHQDHFTFQQVKLFDDVIAELANEGLRPALCHAANSGAAIRFHFPQYNMVRIGLAVYGFGIKDKNLLFRPALTLTSRIVAINQCKKGETISYGRCHTVQRDFTRIAVLPIGYFDGLHRTYNKGKVLIRGQKAPIVGNICMDFTMVDITDIPSASIGDPVLIFGEDEHGCYMAPEELAHLGSSIVHELMTCLGPRIQRIFIYEEK